MRLALVKPDLAMSVEDTLIRAATSGSLKGIVSDDQLKKMLEQFADDSTTGTAPKKKVIIKRRKTCESSDEDDDSDLLWIYL